MRHDAIRNVYANAVTISGDRNVWDADGNAVVIDEALVQAEVARLQAEHEALQYQRDRKAEYPSIEECVHAILDDDLDALQAKRAEIKARYPK